MAGGALAASRDVGRCRRRGSPGPRAGGAGVADPPQAARARARAAAMAAGCVAWHDAMVAGNLTGPVAARRDGARRKSPSQVPSYRDGAKCSIRWPSLRRLREPPGGRRERARSPAEAGGASGGETGCRSRACSSPFRRAQEGFVARGFSAAGLTNSNMCSTIWMPPPPRRPRRRPPRLGPLHARAGLCRAPRAHELLLPRRRLRPGGPGRAGRRAGSLRARRHRSRGSLRRGSLRLGCGGGRAPAGHRRRA